MNQSMSKCFLMLLYFLFIFQLQIKLIDQANDQGEEQNRRENTYWGQFEK